MTLLDKILAIIVVNLAIGLLIRLGLHVLPQLKHNDLQGVYLMLLPLGFGLFGWDVPYWMSTPCVVLGLVMLAFALRRTFRTLTEGAA